MDADLSDVLTFMRQIIGVPKAADEATNPTQSTTSDSEWIYLDTDYSRPPTKLVDRKTLKTIDESLEFMMMTFVNVELNQRTAVAAGMTHAEWDVQV